VYLFFPIVLLINCANSIFFIIHLIFIGVPNRWLALFPMLFSELGKQNRILIDGQTMPGPEYCNEIIHSLCNTTVSKDDAVAFAALLRDLKITNIIASSRSCYINLPLIFYDFFF